MKLIRADLLTDEKITNYLGCIDKMVTPKVRRMIDDAQTIDAIPVEQVAKMLYKVTHNLPCKVLSRPAFDDFDKWCVENCSDDRETSIEHCWLHAIKEGWVR